MGIREWGVGSYGARWSLRPSDPSSAIRPLGRAKRRLVRSDHARQSAIRRVARRRSPPSKRGGRFQANLEEWSWVDRRRRRTQRTRPLSRRPRVPQRSFPPKLVSPGIFAVPSSVTTWCRVRCRQPRVAIGHSEERSSTGLVAVNLPPVPRDRESASGFGTQPYNRFI